MDEKSEDESERTMRRREREHTHICSVLLHSECVCVCVNGPQKDTSQPQSSSVARQQGETVTDRNTAAHTALLLLLEWHIGVCVC